MGRVNRARRTISSLKFSSKVLSILHIFYYYSWPERLNNIYSVCQHLHLCLMFSHVDFVLDPCIIQNLYSCSTVFLCVSFRFVTLLHSRLMFSCSLSLSFVPEILPSDWHSVLLPSFHLWGSFQQKYFCNKRWKVFRLTFLTHAVLEESYKWGKSYESYSISLVELLLSIILEILKVFRGYILSEFSVSMSSFFFSVFSFAGFVGVVGVSFQANE